MERNWDIIREILIKFEEMPEGKSYISLSDFPSRKETYLYHIELLIEAGLIDGEMEKTIGSDIDDFYGYRLTWKGHELLDTIRNDNIWEKTKSLLVEKGLPITFDIAIKAATEIVSKILKQ